MLEALKRGAQTWVAKILFAVLVASFAVWGIADVFTGGRTVAVATVGSTTIDATDVQRAFQSELNELSNQAKQRLTAEQGAALGLDRRVVQQLIGGTAIETHAQNIGLRMSDATIVEGVQSDPDFQGPDGRFSTEGFNFLLRQLGVSEKGFIELRRRDELRNQVIGAIAESVTVPEPMLEIQHKYQNEKRKIEHVTIDADKAVTVAEPDDTKLKAAFEKSKGRYKTPEYRKFEVLLITADDVKKSITVTDEDLKAAYETTKDSYNVPEKRRVQQIAFPTKEAAEAARKGLADGSKTFGDVAKAAGAKDTDVDLGLVGKRDLIDPIVADAAFKLEKGKFSDVVEGRFATVIVRVTQIDPAQIKTFGEVEGQVRDKLLGDKARVELPLKYNEADDLRLIGKTLKEIGETAKLTYREIAAADRRGIGPDDKPALETADSDKIMARVFSSTVETDDTPITLTDGGYAWVNLLGKTEPKEKEFDKVKAEVKAAYMADERARLLGELAKKLVDRMNAGADKAEIEKEAKGKFETSDAVTRATVPQGLSESAVAQAFTLPLNRAAAARSANTQSQTLLRVTEVVAAPAMTEAQRTALADALRPALANQVLTGFTEKLKVDLGTSINEAELRRAIGVSAGP